MRRKIRLLLPLIFLSFAGINSQDSKCAGQKKEEFSPRKSPFSSEARGGGRKALSIFVREYVRLFRHFPVAFAPYKKNLSLSKEGSKKILLRHMCADSFAPICRQYKSRIKSLLSGELELQSTRAAEKTQLDLVKDRFAVMASLDKLFSQLQGEFRKFKSERAAFLRALLKVADGSHDRSLSFFASQLADGWSTSVKASAKVYWRSFLEKTDVYPARILREPLLVKLIEGGYYQLDFSELIVAVDSATNTLKKEAIHILDSRQKMCLESEASGIPPRGGQSDFSIRPPDFSLLQPPVIANDSRFRQVREFSCEQVDAFEFLVKGEVQRAIWELEKVAKTECAQKLRDYFTRELLKKSELIELQPMQKGFTKTMLSVYRGGSKGIYKPRINVFLHPLNAISGSHRKEVAAYELNRLLGIDMVPLTRKITTRTHGLGSEQVFVGDARRARDFGSYNGFRPRKFSSPAKRNRKDKNMLFFDWLISNYDRNLDNYLLTADGTVVMIDHGFSFLRRVSGRPSLMSIQAMMPSRRVYENLKRIDQNPELMEQKVGPWLKGRQYRVLRKQIRYFCKRVEELLREGRGKELFKLGDQEERLRGWKIPR